MADKTVVIPQHSLKPLKIVKWKVNEGNSISIGCVILLYKVDGDDGKETLKLKSTKAGTVHRIVAQEGDVVKFGEPLVELQACIHPTVMKDMCAECGADLRKDDLVMTASVPMIHSVPELKVSLELAKKLGKADSDRLLKDRKLVLLVDLDQTLIHTTNDNIPANLKDVYHFQLYGSNSPWYHTRLRPGTHKFLTNIASLYELHICTFGARNYAHMIAMFLDQDGQLFSHRILSRDECFNPNSKTANLKALFPCGDNMVCIIDDREDVWSYASNLIHVKPYHFFQHTGDINAPPGLDKHEDDDKEGVDLTKVQSKSKKVKVNGSSVEEKSDGNENKKVLSKKKINQEEKKEEEGKMEVDSEESINKLNEKVKKDEKKLTEKETNKIDTDNQENKNKLGSKQFKKVQIIPKTKKTEGNDNVKLTSIEGQNIDDKKKVETTPTEDEKIKVEIMYEKNVDDELNKKVDKTGISNEENENSLNEKVKNEEVNVSTEEEDISHEENTSNKAIDKLEEENNLCKPVEENKITKDKKDKIKDKLITNDITEQEDKVVNKKKQAIDEEQNKMHDDQPPISIKGESNIVFEKAQNIDTNIEIIKSENESNKIENNIKNITKTETTEKKENSNKCDEIKAIKNNENKPETKAIKQRENVKIEDNQADIKTRSKLDGNQDIINELQDETISSDKIEIDADKKEDNVKESNQNSTTSNEDPKLETAHDDKKENELIEIDDPDDYLLYLEEILKIIHQEFYDKYDKLESGDVPDLKKVIPEVRSNILKGTKLVFSGLVPTHIKLEQSKAYQVARSLGAVVSQDLEEDSTHLVAVRPGTAKVNVGRRKKSLKIVTPDWLWACAERWERIEEKLFPLNNKGSKNRHPPPHCSSPEHIPNFETGEPGIIRKRTPSGRFMDTINPLMSFSSADIADMDREVEDIFNESEDETDGEASKRPIAEAEVETEVDNDEILLKKFKPSKDTEDESSSSDESLTGEHPHGWNPKSNSRKRSRDDQEQEAEDESTADEFPSTKFRRGEELSSDLEFGQESNSEGSVDAPDEIDDGDWNMMGAALEREFLSNN